MHAFEILILGGVGVLVGLLLAVSSLILQEVGKTRRFFQDLASRYRGQTTRFPFGLVFTLDRKVNVKVFALQGAIIYKADVRLREDPGVLITRSYPAFRWLDALNYSLARRRARFGTPMDSRYAFRGRNTEWIRKVFTADLQDQLRLKGRVARIEIRRKELRGAMLVIRFTPAEEEKARQSIEILNNVARRVAASSLAAVARH